MLAESAFDDQRLATDGTKRSNWAVDATDENFLSFGEKFARAAIVTARGCLGDADL